MDIFIAIVSSFALGLIVIISLYVTIKLFTYSETVTALFALAFSVLSFIASIYPWLYLVNF